MAEVARLAIDNAVEQLEQAPAIVQETHKLRSLKTRLRTMSLLLKEFNGQEYEPAVAEWLTEVSKVAYETQDVVGSIAEANYQKQRSKLGRLLSGGKVPKNHLDEVDGIGKRIENICSFSTTNKVQSSISFNEDEVVGLEDAQKTLVKEVIGNGSELKVILIFGKAGSGKTTLAKMIFNNLSIKKHFHCREWVPFPQDCFHLDEPKANLSKKLIDKRYLIVVDNANNNDMLNELTPSLPDELNGSRILLTSQAALNLQQRISFSYEVKPLDEKQSWKLLSRKVLEGENHPVLEDLGKRMANRCDGSPRAIVATAAILNHAEKSEAMWSKFLEDCDGFFKYHDLPQELKLCLLYFGLFPAESPISAKQMIQMWMAEELLKPKGSNRAEIIGEQNLEKLKDKSFIKEGKKRLDESVKTFSTSNHVSHCCMYKGAAMKFFKVHKDCNSEAQKDIRIAIHNDSFLDVLKSFGNCPDAKSLHCFGKNTIRSVDLWKTLHRNFCHLHVLNLGFVELDKVPKELGKLTKLKYLRLWAPSVKHLPYSIVNLHQLETLDMRESEELVSLPHGIWKMKYLRHLYLGGCASLPKTRGIDYYKALPNLQTLSGVHPGKVLKQLMVRAKFPSVTKLRICSTKSELTRHFLNSLDHLYHLQSLRIENPTELPIDLDAFPLSLTKLTLLETKLPATAMKTLEKLPNLRILKLLKEAFREEINCSAEGFLQLEVLCLENLAVKLTLESRTMQCVKLLLVKGSNIFDLETAPDHLKPVVVFKGSEGNGTQ